MAILHARIATHGPITFAEYMETVLYHPEYGYYRSPVRRPGRGGDFITAPELHPSFGLTLARQVAECWDRLDRPAPFTIREYGSGIGGLAYDIIVGLLDARPDIRPALRYLLNDINPYRTEQALAAMAEAGFADIVAADSVPARPIAGVVIANEVADALPVHRLVWRPEAGGPGEFHELYVGSADDGQTFADVEAELSPGAVAFDPAGWLSSQGVDPGGWADGSRIEISPVAEGWMREVGAGLERGYALVIDYGYPTDVLYRDHRLEGTVRAYVRHTVTDDPYVTPGAADLTAHVDFTRLQRAAEAEGMEIGGLTTQGDALANLGLGEFLVRLQDTSDVAIDEYYRAQAAVFRLIDPAGLGRFRVLALARNAPVRPPLGAFTAPVIPGSPSLSWPDDR